MTDSMSGWPNPTTIEGLLTDTQRQLMSLKRRNRLPTAAQILGPGIAPWATLTIDWSSEETVYNGIFYTEVGALNSPDDTKGWIGTTYATQDGRGTQEVTELAPAIDPAQWRRTFTTSPAGTRTFTPWREVSSPTGPDVQQFTADGTWVKPDGAVWLTVEVIGGGGAGGGSGIAAGGAHSVGAGGGAGAHGRSTMDADAVTDSVAITIGAAGTPASGAAGGNGGASSFGAYVTAPGGGGGQFAASNTADFGVTGGTGGAAGTADLAIPGAPGLIGMGNAGLGSSGTGASTPLGAGGIARNGVSASQALAGAAGTGYGSGGSGAVSTGGGAAAAGGAGAPGLVIVTAHFA